MSVLYHKTPIVNDWFPYLYYNSNVSLYSVVTGTATENTDSCTALWNINLLFSLKHPSKEDGDFRGFI